MRGALLASVLALLAGCAAASAQPPAIDVCHTDADCELHQGCCPRCCACPQAMTHARAAQLDAVCAIGTCAAPDCRGRECSACPSTAVCSAGACTTH